MGNPNEKPKLRRMAIMPPNGESKYGRTPQWVEKATKDFLDFLPEANHIKELPYTKPKLRESIKRRIMASSDGGRPGQWSARKSQLLAQEYRKAGGGYRGKPRKQQQALNKWTKEQWRTVDGKPAFRRGKMSRYLPAKAWQRLTPAQRKATIRKKLQSDEQFVPNTERAARASQAIRGKALGASIGAGGGSADTMDRRTQTSASKPSGTSRQNQTATPSGRTIIGGGTSSSSSENYNPKARDGDGDGNVQEGTDYERQANTKPKAEEDTNSPPVEPKWIDQSKIDMSTRKPVYLGMGKYGVVAPIMIQDDGRYVIIPTIDEKGKPLTYNESLGLYGKFNDHLGKFDYINDAQKYLDWLRAKERKQIADTFNGIANGEPPKTPTPTEPNKPKAPSLDDINWDDFAKLVEGEARKLKPGQITNWNAGELPNGGLIADDGRYIPAPLEKGNIDLSKRQGVELPDGSIATIRSISINEDGKEVLIPSIGPKGENWDPKTREGLASAIEQYKNSGQHLGKFSNAQEADVYAEWLHQQEEIRVSGTTPPKVGPASPPNVPTPPKPPVKPVGPRERGEGSLPKPKPQTPSDTPTERRGGPTKPEKPSLLLPPVTNAPPTTKPGTQFNPLTTTTAPPVLGEPIPPKRPPATTTPPTTAPPKVGPAIPPKRPPTTTKPITPISPKQREEGGRTQVGPKAKPKITVGVEERRAGDYQKGKQQEATALDSQFVRGLYDLGDNLEYGSPWNVWENPEFSSMKDGQAVLLTNIQGQRDIQNIEYAIGIKINGSLVVAELDERAYSQIQKDGKQNIADANFLSSKQYRKMQEVASGFDTIHSVFPDMNNPLRQIIITADPSADDAIRNDGFVTQGEAQQGTGTYVLFPSGASSTPEQLKRVIVHETAHILAPPYFDTYTNSSSMTWEDIQAQDAKISQNFTAKNGFVMDDIPQGDYHAPQIGSQGITEYGKTNINEDWAESFLYYCVSQNNGRLGTDNEGNPVTFEDLYPNRAKLINEWMSEREKQYG